MEHLISSILLISVVGAIVIGLSRENMARTLAITFSGVMFLLSLVLGSGYDMKAAGFQMEDKWQWFSYPFPVGYHVAVDGMSLCLVILTTFIMLMSVLASERVAQKRSRLYYSLLMLLSTSILGVFVSLDALQFFVFYELELVPMYFLIAIWGGANRSYAAMKFLLYTFFGGALMLASLVCLTLVAAHVAPSTFSLDYMTLQSLSQDIPLNIQYWCFLGFFLAFIIKLPSVPFHTWLPDAHVEAPTPVSMILAGLLLKMGSYGLVRFCFGLFPAVVGQLGVFLICLGAVNVVWGAIACLVQEDMKRVIAYSSVSHMGLILIGLGSLSAAALNGAIFQMLSHGFISAALFFLVGVVYDRTHTRNIAEIGGGLAKEMPCAFYFWMFAAMANLGLPGLAGFVAEVTVFYGSFTSVVANAEPGIVHGALIAAATGVILSAGYMLWLLKRLFYGPVMPKWVGHMFDMTKNEKFVAVCLSVCMIIFGICPLLLTRYYKVYSDDLCAPFLSATRESLNQAP